MVATKPTVGQEVTVKLKNFTASRHGPFKDVTLDHYFVKGRVVPLPEWEREPDVFAVEVQNSDVPLRIVHLRNVLEINGAKHKYKPDPGYEVHYVKSKRTDEVYKVERFGDRWVCACKGFGFRKQCAHIKEFAKS